MAIRPSGRAVNEARAVSIDRDFTKHAAGAVLIAFGDTKVICTASVEHQVPPFMRGKGRGWITAEYGMLPGATHTRTDREAARGKQGGRTVEIQRLIGRSLRAAVDLKALGERTVRIDCDVLQADGGTRTASITGGCIALADALGKVAPKAFLGLVASVSVGIYRGACVLDLDYAEDSNADTDMNVVMMDAKGFIEVQGTAERGAFQRAALDELLELAELGIGRLFEAQKTRARGMTESARDRAQAFVREMIARDVLTFGDFTLKSGRRSPYFFNLGMIADGDGLEVLGAAYAAEAMQLPTRPDVVFGPAYKGIPIATATAVAMLRDHGRNIGAAFNRKEVKTHGEGGHLVGAPMAGRHVAIVDDVVTDGAAKREAFEMVTAAGGEVVGVVLALDRQEGVGGGPETAVQALQRSFGVPVRCVANVDDVVGFLGADDRFRSQRERLSAYRRQNS